MPFPSGRKCIHWEICWQTYWSSVVGNCLSLAALKTLSLSFIFVILIKMFLGVHFFGSILFGTLCLFWTWCLFPLPGQGNFQPLFLQTSFWFLAYSLLLLVSLWCSCCSGSPLDFPHFLKFVFFCCSAWVFSVILFPKLLIWSSVSSNLLLIPYSEFFISDIIVFISDSFFF